jgi:hypothetical protein
VAEVLPFHEVLSLLKGAFVGRRYNKGLYFGIFGFEFGGKKVQTLGA